jgi:hypothetical protein
MNICSSYIRCTPSFAAKMKRYFFLLIVFVVPMCLPVLVTQANAQKSFPPKSFKEVFANPLKKKTPVPAIPLTDQKKKSPLTSMMDSAEPLNFFKSVDRRAKRFWQVTGENANEMVLSTSQSLKQNFIRSTATDMPALPKIKWPNWKWPTLDWRDRVQPTDAHMPPRVGRRWSTRPYKKF